MLAQPKRAFGTAALLAYCSALSFVALVEPLRPAVLDRPHSAVAATLASVGLFPGLAVFRGEEERDLHHRALCVAVVGTTNTGEKVTLHAQMGDCEQPTLRLVVNKWDLTHQMLVIEGTWNPDGIGAAKFRSLADFYCHSPLVANDLKSVSIASVQHRVSRDGVLDQRAFLHMHYLCAENSAAPSPWPPLRDVLP